MCEGFADIFEFIVDGLNQRPFTQEHLVTQVQKPVAHILAQLGDEANP